MPPGLEGRIKMLSLLQFSLVGPAHDVLSLRQSAGELKSAGKLKSALGEQTDQCHE